MTQLDRRTLLASLAGGVAVAGVAPAIAEAAPETDAFPSSERHNGWLIGQQDAEGEHAVSFWSMNYTANHFADHLPPQISRGLIAYHDFDRRTGATQSGFDPLQQVFEYCDHKWIEPEQIDRFILRPDTAVTSFPAQLMSFVGTSGTGKRTALIDIESSTAFDEDRWMSKHIPPAFASCYDSVIGLCHFDQRGLRQQKAHCEKFPIENAFEESFLNPAAGCDAVIVTSAGLIETDCGLSPSASTDELVAEVVRRLGHALLAPEIRDGIVASGRADQRKPRFYALSSATLNAPFEPPLHLQMMLDRQSAFVTGSFAPLATDELPLFIATALDGDLKLRANVLDVLAYNTFAAGYSRDAEIFRASDVFYTADAPRYQTESRRPGALDLIALWPFKMENA